MGVVYSKQIIFAYLLSVTKVFPLPLFPFLYCQKKTDQYTEWNFLLLTDLLGDAKAVFRILSNI